MFAYGEGAAFDPITRVITIGEDIAPGEASSGEIGKLARAKAPANWRGATVSAELPDGTTEEVGAGVAADVLGKRVKKALALLDCLR